MENKKTSEPISISKTAKIVIGLAIGIPAILAYLFTEMQWYPATILIEWLADDEGTFSFKSAVLLNWGALMLCEFTLLIPVLLIKKMRSKK